MKKRKTRTIKPIKRYNPAAMISSFLTMLLSVALIIGLIYLPLFKFDVEDTSYNIYALNILNDAVYSLKGQTFDASKEYLLFKDLFINQTLGAMWEPLGTYFPLIVSIFLLLAILFSFIGALGGLICLCVGYIAGEYKAPKVFAGLNFLFIGLLIIWPVISHTILQLSTNPNHLYIHAFNALLFVIVAFVIWMSLKIIYRFGLKDRVFYKKLDKIIASRNEELSHRRSNQDLTKPLTNKTDESKLIEFSNEDEINHFVELNKPNKPKEELHSVNKDLESKINIIPDINDTKIKQEELLKPIMEVKEEEDSSVVSFDESKGLPSDIKELNDHQFSKNVKLEVANIPDGIIEIGPSCFSNCINLKFVKIPNSVKTIRFNAFFGCKKLTTINFDGTRHEWRAINRGSNWLTGAGTDVIVCKDGSLKVNPMH